METKTKIAVVTGGNRGIGFAVVRGLCKQFDGDVILTARDEGRGLEAVKEFEKEDLKPKFHQLDIEDHESVVKLEEYLKKTYGGLDVLVNNAGISYNYKGKVKTTPLAEQTEVINSCNFFGTLDVCRVLFPLLRPHARVCNVSSVAATLSLNQCSDEMYKRFLDPNITMDELESLIQQFVKLAKEDKHQEAGFSNNAYGISKIGVTVMSIIQQRELDSQGAQDIVVNACCPGFVDTDMSGHWGYKTMDQGADTPVYLAMLPPGVDSPRGKYVVDKQIQPLVKLRWHSLFWLCLKWATYVLVKGIRNKIGAFF